MSATILESQIIDPGAGTTHVIRELPVLVLMAHNRCNCRCVMCDIWRIRRVREITAADLEPHLASLRALKVRWVVFSGGEPLMHSDLFALARALRREGIRTTLLTAGLMLERLAAPVAENIDDLIVSLDGPESVHNCIRGIAGAFRRLARGLKAVKGERTGLEVHGRCTVQRQNVRYLRPAVQAALELNLDSISFLAADISSEAFNRTAPWPSDRVSQVAPGPDDLAALEAEISALITDYSQHICSGFIRESPDKLRRIATHFRAHLGQAAHEAPRCNAPWVSAVIESDGTVRPCFFHRPIGNLRDATLAEVVNGDAAMQFRSQLDVSRNPQCRRCVCSLFLKTNMHYTKEVHEGEHPTEGFREGGRFARPSR